MRMDFTKEDIEGEYNKIELDGEDVTLMGSFIETVEGEENTYTITGDAIVEGELYHDFITIFGLAEAPKAMTARNVAEAEWDWFDYICD